MLRGIEHKRRGSGGEPVRQQGGLGAVVPVPLVGPRRKHRSAGNASRLMALAGVLLGAFCAGAAVAMLQISAGRTAMAECTILVLDRDTGHTFAGPCVGWGPPLPSTLTALLPGALTDHGAAAR